MAAPYQSTAQVFQMSNYCSSRPDSFLSYYSFSTVDNIGLCQTHTSTYAHTYESQCIVYGCGCEYLTRDDLCSSHLSTCSAVGET